MNYVTLNRNDDMVAAVDAEDFSRSVLAQVRGLDEDDYLGEADQFFEAPALAELLGELGAQPGDTLSYHGVLA